MSIKNMAKDRKGLIITLSIIIAVIITAVILVLVLPAEKPAAAEHDILNALPETVDHTPYLKNGSLYMANGAQSVLISDGIYKKDDIEAAQLFDYVWSAKSKDLIYLKDAEGAGELIRYSGGKNQLIAGNVDSWCTVEALDRVAYIINENTDLQTGMLMLNYNNQSSLLDINIQPSSVRFSSDGQYLFALKCHDTSELSTGIGDLIKYDMQGNSEIIQKNVYGVNWISYDGGAYICLSQNENTILYDYLLVAGDKSLTINGVYASAITDDRSLIYLLADYDAELETGTLYTVSLSTLAKTQLAQNVAYINHTTLTDLTKGILYSSPGQTQGKYDIYYVTVNKQAFRMIKDAYEDSLQTIYLNTQNQTGYILMHGVTEERNSLHYVEWSGKSIKDKKIDDGVHEAVYYEASDSILYIKNGEKNTADLYMVTANKGKKLIAEGSGAMYNSSMDSYYSCSLLSNDGKKLLYFTNLINTEESELESHPIASLYGTLNILDIESGNSKEISKLVMTNASFSLLSDGAMNNIYFMTLNGDRLNLCLYSNQEVTVIDENIMNMLVPTL